MKDFVLEIGCENLPASYIQPALIQMEREMELLLQDSRLDCSAIRTAGTPRRLVLFVKKLSVVQRKTSEDITGPPASAAFDAGGNPTSAALGFARSKNLAPGKLKIISTKKGDYAGFTRKLPSRTASAVLRERLPGFIAGLKFPKTMRWENESSRFARPVRWIVCLHGSSVVKLRFGGVTAGRKTCKVPWLDGKKIVVKSAASYTAHMKRLGIIVEQTGRLERLKTLADKAAAKAGLKLVADDELFEEICFMLENPRVFIGEFPQKFMDLPPEVIITAMKTHQRYFALRQKRSKKLAARFLAFYDGAKKSAARIRKGNEKVLNARLADAHFYWRADIDRGIDNLSKKLESMVFIKGLGTIMDKSIRMKAIMEYIHKRGPSPALSAGSLGRAALLAKADLASEMIKDGKEFTLLQGLIGSHYAGAAGESAEVVQAISEHYMPRTVSDPLPSSPGGILLSISDKIDNICGCFLAGFKPTGSQDPYALRRQAAALIRILEDQSLISLDALIKKSVSLYKSGNLPRGADFEKIRGGIEDFFRTRIRAYLAEKGIDYDIVDAVVPVAWMTPKESVNRCAAINETRSLPAFELLIRGVKRVGNILPSSKKRYGADLESISAALDAPGKPHREKSFKTDLFQEAEERNLYSRVLERLPQLMEFDESGDFKSIMTALSGLAEAIDDYFDKVLVNTDDCELKSNRINFLACLFAVFSRYADFSYIVEPALSVR